MLSRLRTIVSLHNLVRRPFSFLSLSKLRSPGSRGQIATILLLLIVAAIIMVLVTVNIGNVSVNTMTVVTGTDTAGLFLGSQLASRSHSLYHQLDDSTRACVRGGLLGVILAVIAAVIVVVATYGQGWYAGWVILAAAVAGAVGGALGQYIIHGTASAAVQGAAMGAMIGAAIGSGPAAAAELGLTASPGAAAIEPLVQAGLTTAQAVSAAGGVTLTTTGAVFAVGFSTAAGASAAYNAALTLSMDEGAIKALVQAMNGLPEYEMVRENVYAQALQRVIDDPTKVVDSADLDGDENTDELMPAFVYWWHDHIQALMAALDMKGPIIEQFFNEVFIPYYEQLRFFMLPTLDRKEVECTCSPAESRGIGLLRVLDECGYPVSWEPGPERQPLIDWYCNPDDIPPPDGYDYIDGLRYIFEEFINYGRGVLKESEDNCGIYYEYDVSQLDKQLKFNDCGDGEQDWFDQLYCPNDPDEEDLLSALEETVEILDGGIEQIMSIRGSLPGCQLKYGIYVEQNVESGIVADPINDTDGGGHACQCPIPSDQLRVAAARGQNDTVSSGWVGGEGGGETYEETTALCEEVFPCYWVNQSSYWCGTPDDVCGLQQVCISEPAPCLEDIHFPNPVCKVYPADREQLLSEINDLRELVANLEEHITERYFCDGDPCPTPPGETQLDPDTLPEYDPDIDLTVPPVGCDPGFDMCNICPPTADPGNFSNLTNGTVTNTTGNTTNITDGDPVDVPDCVSRTVAIDIDVGRVCLYGNVHDGCSRTPLGSGDGILRYEFSYNVTCSCCDYSVDTGSTMTNTTTNTTIYDPITNTTTNVTINTTIVTNTTDVTAEYTPASLSGQAWGWTCVAPDLDLNVVGLCEGEGDCLMRDDFLAQLDRFEEYLLDLTRETSECDPDPDDGILFATIDQDAYDEFAPVTETFCNTMLATQEFIEEVPNWEPELQVDRGTIQRAENGAGESPLYEWDDNRGHHSVQVRSGPFHFAWVKKRKSGNFAVNKTCVEMRDYCDNYSPCSRRHRINPGDTWVEVIRQDDPDTRDLPAAGKVNLGLRWNPFYNGRVRRRARVSYTYNFVGIGDVNW